MSLLVDRYNEDWERLCWVRADGPARIVDRGPELERAVALLPSSRGTRSRPATPTSGRRG